MLPLKDGKNVICGLESSGKSLALASVVWLLIDRNAKWRDKYNLEVRKIYSNQKYSADVLNYAQEMGVPIIYWEYLDTIAGVEEADVICDEMSRYFEARRWALLPSYVIGWITQIDKLGVQFYGTCQSFGQIDKSFRDTTQHLYQFKKIMGSMRPSKTKPPIKFVWGVFLRITLDVDGINNQTLEDTTSWFLKLISMKLFTLKKIYCNSYDTQQKIIPNNRILTRHIVKYCNVCNYEHVFHD